MKFNAMLLSLALLTVSAQVAFAEKTVKEEMTEAGNDTKRGAKNAVREVKDKTCEMVNGKMECAVQKTKHSIQRGADKVEDAID